MKEYTIKIPKWFTRKLIVFVFLIVAAGAGCFYWGMWSVDLNGEIEEYLLAESQEMQRGRNAGYTVMLVGNETMSSAWITLCNEVIDNCVEILEGG